MDRIPERRPRTYSGDCGPATVWVTIESSGRVSIERRPRVAGGTGYFRLIGTIENGHFIGTDVAFPALPVPAIRMIEHAGSIVLVAFREWCSPEFSGDVELPKMG